MSEESTKYFYDRIEAQRVEIEKLRAEKEVLETKIKGFEALLKWKEERK